MEKWESDEHTMLHLRFPNPDSRFPPETAKGRELYAPSLQCITMKRWRCKMLLT